MTSASAGSWPSASHRLDGLRRVQQPYPQWLGTRPCVHQQPCCLMLKRMCTCFYDSVCLPESESMLCMRGAGRARRRKAGDAPRSWGFLPNPPHPMLGMRGGIPSTRSCQVKLANVCGATISYGTPWHDQSELRKVRRGSSAWKRFHLPSIGSSFSSAFSCIARSAWRYTWVVSMLS
jgi:hypothetical protein